MAESVSPEDLTFPVLAVGHEMSVVVFKDSASLQTANALAIRQGVYRDLLIVDADGQSYSISDVLVVGSATRFFGIRFMKPRLLKIALRLRPAGIVTLTDLQEQVVATTNEEPSLWDSAWDRDLQDLQARIRSAKTFPELFALFDD